MPSDTQHEAAIEAAAKALRNTVAGFQSAWDDYTTESERESWRERARIFAAAYDAARSGEAGGEQESRERFELIQRFAQAFANPECDADCEGTGIDVEGSEWTLCECVQSKLERIEAGEVSHPEPRQDQPVNRASGVPIMREASGKVPTYEPFPDGPPENWPTEYVSLADYEALAAEHPGAADPHDPEPLRDGGERRCSKSSICVLGDGHIPPCKFQPGNLLAGGPVEAEGLTDERVECVASELALIDNYDPNTVGDIDGWVAICDEYNGKARRVIAALDRHPHQDVEPEGEREAIEQAQREHGCETAVDRVRFRTAWNACKAHSEALRERDAIQVSEAHEARRQAEVEVERLWEAPDHAAQTVLASPDDRGGER